MEGAGTEGPREDTLAYGHENHGLSLWCRSTGVPPPTMLFLVLKSTAQCMEGGTLSGSYLIERMRGKEVEGYREMSRGLSTAEMKSSPCLPHSD